MFSWQVQRSIVCGEFLISTWTDSNVGGGFGEIVALKGKIRIESSQSPLVVAQIFEYKISKILEKILYVLISFFAVDSFEYWLDSIIFKGIGIWIYHGSSWKIQCLSAYSVKNDSTGDGHYWRFTRRVNGDFLFSVSSEHVSITPFWM